MTKKEAKQYDEIMGNIPEADVLRKIGLYLQNRGFSFSVVGNQTLNQLHASVVTPNGFTHLYQSDAIDLLEVSKWAWKIAFLG